MVRCFGPSVDCVLAETLGDAGRIGTGYNPRARYMLTRRSSREGRCASATRGP